MRLFFGFALASKAGCPRAALAPSPTRRAWFPGMAVFLCWLALGVGTTPAALARDPVPPVPGYVRLVGSPFPPYHLGDYGDAAFGDGPRTAQEIFRRLGLDITYTLQPWRRMLRMLATGQADGSCIISRDPERDAFLVYSRPLFWAQEAVFYDRRHRPGFVWRDFEDLRPLTLGLVEGHPRSPQIRAAIRRLGLRVVMATSMEVNLAKLYNGRVDLCVGNSDQAAWVIGEHDKWRKALAQAEHLSAHYPVYLALSRRSPMASLMPLIDTTISDLRREGFAFYPPGR